MVFSTVMWCGTAMYAILLAKWGEGSELQQLRPLLRALEPPSNEESALGTQN